MAAKTNLRMEFINNNSARVYLKDIGK